MSCFAEQRGETQHDLRGAILIRANLSSEAILSGADLS